uniref:EF-hand domain-containing protein n=2 Tax=Macrostomum lignano TaxID=282301 RepID=A0A1I8IBQ9_9PLAT
IFKFQAEGHSVFRATPQQLQAYSRFCSYTEEEVNQVLAKYRQLDRSRNHTAGVWYEDLAGKCTEMQGNRLLTLAAKAVAGSTSRLDVDRFVRLVWLLSSQASVQEKRDLLWRVLDPHQTGRVRRAGLFRFLSATVGGNLADDQLLDLVESALAAADPKPAGLEPELTREYFFSAMVSDLLVFQKLTADLHYN